MASLADQLRRAMNRSHMTRYELSKRSGINQGTLSRFARGKAGITLDVADKICTALRLELTQKKGEK